MLPGAFIPHEFLHLIHARKRQLTRSAHTAETRTMDQFSDRILARRMIEARDCGHSFALFFRRYRKHYLLLVSYFGILLVASALVQFWMIFCAALGMLAGALLRDIGWMRSFRKTFPFSMKVTDWEKVTRIADDKDAGE